MKKIIAAIDGLKYSDSTVKHAIDLARQSNAHLVGLMLDDFTYHSYKIFELAGNEGIDELKHRRLEKKDQETRKRSVIEFETLCKKAGINYSIHYDRNIALQELLHESVYADLLVIDSRETLTHYEEKVPTRFIRNLLSEIQCPALIVPHTFENYEKIILLYDGEPSSVFAIKSFSYILPALKYLDTEVISVNSDKQSLHLPDNTLMKEFMKRHYPEATYTVLQGNAEEEIIKKLRNEGAQTLVVLGAYRRGMVSRWFRPSMADVLMEGLNLSLFIAHNK